MAKKGKKIKITPRREPPPSPKEERDARTMGEEQRQRVTIGRNSSSNNQQPSEEPVNFRQQYQQLRRAVLIGGIALGVILLVGGLVWWGTKEKPSEPDRYYRYGIPLDSFQIRQDIILSNQTLDDILVSHAVPLSQIPKVTQKAQNHFNPDRLEEGARMTVLTAMESGETQALIYEPTPYEYHLLDLRDSLSVQHIKREVELRLESAGGIIDSVLWEAVLDKGLRHELIGKMEEALKWSIDLYHLNPGDRFKLVYQARYADGDLVGIEELQAIYFQTRSKAVSAYFHPDLGEFVDQEGRPMRRPRRPGHNT
ncbi:MAG: hypothetical protein AAF399_29545, partial [Bacteroidota bacterium]